MNVMDLQVRGPVDAESLHGGIDDVKALNPRVGDFVGAKELGLDLAPISSHAVPPSLSLTIDGVTGGAFDNNILARDGNERSGPLFISESCLAREYYLGCGVSTKSRRRRGQSLT